MMFIYLFITALAAVFAGWYLRGRYDEMEDAALSQEVDDQLAEILKLERTVERLETIAAGREKV